jgi:hypothetical protein
MPSPHMFGPSGSCGASDRTPRVDQDRPASQRYRLRLRLSRLHAFCAWIPTAFRHSPGAVGADATGSDNARVRATLGKSKGPLWSDPISARFGQREPTQQWATIPKVRNTPNDPMDARVLARLRVCRILFDAAVRASTSEASAKHHRPRRSTKSFLVKSKSPTSVWRRSMSSTRKMPNHHRSYKNQGWPPDAVRAVPVASAVPTGRNLRSLQRQRSRRSIETRSLRTARTAFGTPDLRNGLQRPGAR